MSVPSGPLGVAIGGEQIVLTSLTSISDNIEPMPDTLPGLRLGLRLTPHGRLSIESMIDAPELDSRTAARLTDAFGRGSG